MARHIFRISLLLILMIFAFIGAYFVFTSGRLEESGRIGILVTIAPQKEFVERIGGDRVLVTTLLPEGASPHTYEPSPGVMTAAARSDIYFSMGSGLEFESLWMDKLGSGNPGLAIINSSKDIAVLNGDPHVWTSPKNAKKLIGTIAETLVAHDPGHADFYLSNRDHYLMELDILHGYIQYRLDGYANRDFLVYHPSFGYFSDLYGLNQIPIEADGKQPTPDIIRNTLLLAQRHDIRYLFYSPGDAAGLVRTIAAEIGAEPAVVDPLAKNYISHMGRFADLLAAEFENESRVALP